MLTGLAVLLLGLGIAVAAVKLHDVLKGETLVHDIADEIALCRGSLAEFDRRWAANSRSFDAIISLSSSCGW